jgi:tetratricopeptide (TPR) repeat protein
VSSPAASVAPSPAPPGPAPGNAVPIPVLPVPGVAEPSAGARTAVTLLFGAAIAAVAFIARGGLDVGRTTFVEIVATVASAAIVACALATAPLRSRFWGGATLAALILLAAWTAVSVSWSIEPSASWIEANRTLSYGAVFAAGLALVRLGPQHWPSLLGGVVLACFVVSGYSLLTKVFPGALSPTEFYSRLREPFGYWNAAGLMGALGVPACLWLGARRSGNGVLNALAFPVLGLLLVTMMISYSRGSLVAAGVGLAVWFALVPLRLRGFFVLLVATVPAALVTAWVFDRAALTKDNVIVPVRADAGHELGVLLLLLVGLLLLAGLAVSFAEARPPLRGTARRNTGIAVVIFVALIPVAGLIAMAESQRGIGGNVSRTWRQFTDPDASVPSNDPSRLTASGSVRARYWRDGLEIYDDQPWIGLGAGAYATARLRVRQDTAVVRHAHGYWAQTLADLGLVGLAISVLAAIAWLWAAARAVGLGVRRTRIRAPAGDPERVGLVTLGTIAIVFSVHSLVDWTWFVPGCAMPALLCAGWVAGRGPAFQPVLPRPVGRARLVRLASAAAVVLVSLVAAWAMWQPLRSIDSGEEALTLAENGRFTEARAQAHEAHDENPLAVEPLFELAAVQEASGRPALARSALVDAVRLQPANPEPWERLATFELRQGRPKAALRAARAAEFLDPRSPQTRRLFLRAVRASTPAAAQPPTPPGTATPPAGP